ncbi:MAG: DMT family transporter [Rickettsiales bacterium]|nr:DMT family transporter [Rickettsiales bacterium]
MNLLKKMFSNAIVKQGFTLAAIIYFFNSVGNVAQGVFIKYYQHKLSIELYELMTQARIVEIVLLLPFCLKYLRHFTKNLKIVLLLAGLYSSDMLLFHRGLKSVPINTGTLIMLLVPLWIILLGRVLLKEKKFNKVNALFLAMCLFGVFFTIYKEVSFAGFNAGYLFLLADAFVIPLGLILQKKYSECRPVVYAVFTNALVLSVLGYGMSGCKIAEFSLQNLEGAFVVALFDMMECFAVYTAYKMTDCSLLQPIRFTRIFISMVLSYLVLKEQVLSHQVIGAAIILFANVGSVIYSRKRQND